jgi:hypothetical protein
MSSKQQRRLDRDRRLLSHIPQLATGLTTDQNDQTTTLTRPPPLPRAKSAPTHRIIRHAVYHEKEQEEEGLDIKWTTTLPMILDKPIRLSSKEVCPGQKSVSSSSACLEFVVHTTSRYLDGSKVHQQWTGSATGSTTGSAHTTLKCNTFSRLGLLLEIANGTYPTITPVIQQDDNKEPNYITSLDLKLEAYQCHT